MRSRFLLCFDMKVFILNGCFLVSGFWFFADDTAYFHFPYWYWNVSPDIATTITPQFLSVWCGTAPKQDRGHVNVWSGSFCFALVLVWCAFETVETG